MVIFRYMDRTFTMSMCSLLLILPLCFPRKIDFLRVPSTVGVLAIFYVIGLVAYKYFSGEYTPGPIKTRPDHWSDVFLVVPTICFGYQCHVSAVPIYSCMKRRNVWQFGLVSSIAILICVFCYTSTAIFGYLTFGGNVRYVQANYV
jgi:sodium-coupled neutral amino acid transporter 7/8